MNKTLIEISIYTFNITMNKFMGITGNIASTMEVKNMFFEHISENNSNKWTSDKLMHSALNSGGSIIFADYLGH